MLYWAIALFIIALLAGVLGFGGFVTGNLMIAAKILFFVFIVLLIISVVTGKRFDPYV